MTAHHSAIYAGRVMHRRFTPRPHAFSYGLYMFYLDLDELPGLSSALFGVERHRPLSFWRKDYHGDPNRPLRDEVWATVERTLGVQERGPVRLLTHVRSFGYVFNPVSFYYCFDTTEVLRAIVAEITNTPWRERHAYVLPADPDGTERDFAKRFHVSPFFGMEQRYHWRFNAPAESLSVTMHNRERAKRVFTAGLGLRRKPFTSRNLLAHAVRHPAMGLTIHAAIYLQALRLRLKGTPFYAHPKTLEGSHHGTDNNISAAENNRSSFSG